MMHVSCTMYHVLCIMYYVLGIMLYVLYIMYYAFMYHVLCIIYYVLCIIYYVLCIYVLGHCFETYFLYICLLIDHWLSRNGYSWCGKTYIYIHIDLFDTCYIFIDILHIYIYIAYV